MNKVKGIIFDAGDVIYDATLWRRWFYKEIKDKIALNLNYNEMWYLWDEYYLRDIYLKRADYKSNFKRFINDIKNNNFKISEILKIAFKGKRELEDKTKPYRWVKLYLPKIKAKEIKMGILTDSESSSANIIKRYEKWSIAYLFDTIVSSADTGVIKPYPEAYRNILKCMNLKENNCVFIGHDKDELIGAKNIGIRAIDYFNKKQFKSFLNEIISK